MQIRIRSYALGLVAVLAAALPLAAPAQAPMAPYKFDAGASLGMSGYIGEANSSSILKHPGFVFNLSGRYIYDTRWAFSAMLSTLSLSGNTADMSNVLPDGAAYSFSSQVFDLGVRGEFNFFAYGIGENYKNLRRCTPYLTLGVGFNVSSSGGSTSAAPNIPMGVGVKYKLRERLNLCAEFTMTKVFGDHVDGPDLANINMIKTAFYKNTDWFSRLTIGISYEFGKRCETCHYVD